MNSAEKNPADVTLSNAPTERLEGVLRKSDDESSEEQDFKSPKNTVRRMRKSKKTSEIETNQVESLTEEDIDEDLYEDNYLKEKMTKTLKKTRKQKR
ncbi:hypothetical protein HHI36_001757 [Cryptolaemus montrouzieri]|uniref:Uncharacterized protein n=1 Tax=Cryptolaemus montrouzieri TaxID=559131 RepID=A0ABD2P8J6_9CUCU